MLKIECSKLNFNGLCNMFKMKKVGLQFTRILILVAILATASSISMGTTYYVDPISGSDTNIGTATAPWKTIAFVQSNKSGIAPGDTVYLKSGNYGVVTFGQQYGFYGSTIYGTSWSLPITYKAVTDANVVFTSLSLKGHGDEPTDGRTVNRYLIFEDINITNTLAGGALINISYASHIKFKNITGVGAWGTYASDSTTYGLFLTNLSKWGNITEDIYIEDCDFSHSKEGITIEGKLGENIVIRNTKVHDLTSSAIKLAGDSTGKVLLIEGCEIYNQWPKAESPTNTALTHGSGFSIHRNDLMLRNNIIRSYGNTRSIRFYQSVFPITGYTNITIENNLIYDPMNYFPVELLDIGQNVKFNNNTIIGAYRTNGDFTAKPQRYGTAVIFCPATDWRDGRGFEFYNNVIVGEIGVSSFATPFAFNEDNNIIWGYSSNKIKGDNTKIIVYGIYPNYTVTDVDYFEGSGKFFLGDADFNEFSYHETQYGSGPHYKNFNNAYKLANSSGAIGFGNIATAPIIDLTFNTRDTRPDAGCYEYISEETTVEPNVTTTLPKVELLISPIDAKTVIEGQTLAFDVVVTGAAANLITCTIENLPAGATFTNKHFQWTPKSGQAGLYFLKIVATSADANTATRYVAVTVQQNASYHTPAFGVFLGTSVFEAEKLYVTVNATDPDGDKLLIEAVNLPVGAIFYDNTLIWVPDYGTAGTYKVQFTASDGTNKIATEVSIVIKKATSETYPGKRLIYYWQTTLSLLGKI